MNIKTKVKLSSNWKDIALPSTHEAVEKRFNHTWYLHSYTKTTAVLQREVNNGGLINGTVNYKCDINLIESV